MKAFTAVLVFFFTAAIHAATVRGIVKDISGAPIAGAAVSCGSVHAATDAKGSFELEQGKCTSLELTHPGFQSASVPVAAEVEATMRPALADSIVVSGIRADAATPVTKTDVPREEIEQRYYQQDIPLLLRDTPSVDSYTEAGVGGSGYSYFTLRGISPTRLNFTLDGVPLADSEDMGTYFADFPDLARSLQSIQVQRGVGTSTVGNASFGGSINMQSIDLSQTEKTDARIAGGSYGSRFATIGWQSGFHDGFAAYLRASANTSDGFRDHSGANQRNVFFSLAKQGEDSQLRLTGFSGHERQQMSFYAADLPSLDENLRVNPLGPEDRDSFGYDLAQLQYLKSLSPTMDMTASVYYQRGYGWYRLADQKYGIDGALIGTMATFSWTSGPLTAKYGVNVNEFQRTHTRDTLAVRDYSNYGTKGEANVFAKLSYDSGRWHTYGDAQVRYTNFHYHGDVAIEPIHWTFFNPKVGARYSVDSKSSVYASAGISTREPTRNDLFQGEDNATVAHDLRAVRPERLLDLEAGWDYHDARLDLKANVYAMEFRHEIASTGELSDIGLLLRKNVDRSHRRGVELDAAWQAMRNVRLHTTANLSTNRIHTWTQFYDVYDEAGAYVDSKPPVFHDVQPVLTPRALLTQSIDVTPTPRTSFGLTGRYVAKSYLDNTDNNGFIAPSFFIIDANAGFDVSSQLRVSVEVNNLANRHRIFPSGYDYLFINRTAASETISGIPYYYPQATRNAVVMLDFKM